MKVAIESIALEKIDEGRRRYRVVLSVNETPKAYAFIVPGQNDSDLEWEYEFSDGFLRVEVSKGVKIMNTICEFDQGKTFSFPMEIASEAV